MTKRKTKIGDQAATLPMDADQTGDDQAVTEAKHPEDLQAADHGDGIDQAATLPVYSDQELGRAQALLELDAEFEGEPTRPTFAGGIEFFRDTDGRTMRVVAVGESFFKIEHVKEA